MRRRLKTSWQRRPHEVLWVQDDEAMCSNATVNDAVAQGKFMLLFGGLKALLLTRRQNAVAGR